MRSRGAGGGHRSGVWCPGVIVGLVALGALAPDPARAQTRDKDLWAFAGAGFSRPLNGDLPPGSVGLGVGLFHRLRSAPRLALGGEIGWHSLGSAERRSVLSGHGEWTRDYSMTMVPACLELFYAPPADAGRPAPMLTGGFGLYALKTEWENRRPPPGVIVPRREAKSESSPGVNAGAGIAFASRTSALRGGIDIRYHWVAAEERSLGILAVAGRVYL